MEGSSFYEPYVGGIVGGSSSFTITGCIHDGAIETHGYAAYAGGILGGGREAEISYCQNYGTMTHYYVHGDIGGITGAIGDGTIEYCMNAADLTVVKDTRYSNATIGGLSANGKDIRHSFNCGNITAAGASYVGGISGQGHADYCYNVGTVVSEDRDPRRQILTITAQGRSLDRPAALLPIAIIWRRAGALFQCERFAGTDGHYGSFGKRNVRSVKFQGIQLRGSLANGIRGLSVSGPERQNAGTGGGDFCMGGC